MKYENRSVRAEKSLLKSGKIVDAYIECGEKLLKNIDESNYCWQVRDDVIELLKAVIICRANTVKQYLRSAQ